MEPEIKCAYTQLVPIEELKHYSRNRNKHPKPQLERLAYLIKNHGLRHPVIVSHLSNEVIAGNGRLEALKILGATHVPVDYQDFSDPDAEYAFSVSDNAIALWADLDLSGINSDLPELGPFDFNLLGIENFVLDMSEKNSSEGNQNGGLSEKFLIPPFSVLNAREGWWQDRKRQWLAMGIKSEIGRGGGQQVASFKSQEALEQFRRTKTP